MQLRRVDKQRGHKGSNWRARTAVAKVFCWMEPRLLHGLLPWHHPGNINDPEWVGQWMQLHDQHADGVALLNTQGLRGGPATLHDATA